MPDMGTMMGTEIEVEVVFEGISDSVGAHDDEFCCWSMPFSDIETASEPSAVGGGAADTNARTALLSSSENNSKHTHDGYISLLRLVPRNNRP